MKWVSHHLGMQARLAPHPSDRLIGTSPAIEALRAQICRLSAFDQPGRPSVPTCLIQGETGTGKGLVARTIHDSGPRATGPFVPVNCAAIPETMLEAELFGFEAGSFTDARRAKPGLFEAASGGTLFLDEIDALTLGLQAKLLTAIESKQVRRLGAVTERSVDVKVVAATQVDLRQAVRDGRFREDLYHRLAVLVLVLPPLRDRVEEIFPLANHFLRRASRRLGRVPATISQTARVALEAHPWEGNVRELRSVMERAALVCKGGQVEAPDLAFGGESVERPPTPGTEPLPSGNTLRDIERQVLIRTLALADGNQSQAARILGMHESTLRFRLRRAGIATPKRAAGS